jgi:hypothetical protein
VDYRRTLLTYKSALITSGGLDTEDDYPYTATDGECEKKKMKRRVVSIDGYNDVPANDEKALKKVGLICPPNVHYPN